MFTDQINVLAEKENELKEVITTNETLIKKQKIELSAVQTAKAHLTKLQEKLDGQTAVS